ncbi:MAG TPA: cytochrome ubiquinol oxidase subunit I [Gemmataceae bacterium]|nr:cytochrome ubiquinol oxidase subunit I [Gemmataceae bacterium]
MDPIFYPVNDFGPLMKGLVIGGLGIFHVFTAQFAIGGGMLLCYFQWLAMTGRSATARRFLDGYFKFLVLLSFVAGALTGVGMWFTTIQLSPVTIGLMVDEFHWLWAVEWTFFSLEVTAGYAFYRYGANLTDRTRLALLVLYTIGSWFSLFWINGILSWQLTPGGWVESGSLWAGFFNPSFWPSLVFRTIAALTVAALVAMVLVNIGTAFDREQRTELINHASKMLIPMVAMPLLGLWWLAVLPEDSREWVLGGSVAMTMFLQLAILVSSLIGGYAFYGLLKQKLYINGLTAGLLCALAFTATAFGEFVREGVRKPYTVRETLYSNSVRPEDVARLREVGCATADPYPVRGAGAMPTDQLRLGAKVFRNQCSICHTTAGVNSLPGLTKGWDADLKRMNFAKVHRLKAFMPPFAGTPAELEALVQYVGWLQAGSPGEWADSLAGPEREALLGTIQKALEEGVR